jgi:son of sevenless-like protein
MAIISGLERSSVHRLKKTWKLLDRKSVTKFQELKSFLDTRGNMKVIRKTIKTSTPPIIPYLGTCCFFSSMFILV